MQENTLYAQGENIQVYPHVNDQSLEQQQQFFQKFPSLMILAFMEYIARVAPLFWPAEYEFLIQENNMILFFEKIPLICDEFRVINLDFSWENLEAQATLKIHKCNRARRLNKCESVLCKKKRPFCEDINSFLDCPIVHRNDKYNTQDVHLLSHAFDIALHELQEGHSLIKINKLPKNITHIQHEQMASNHKCLKLRFVSSRLFVCVFCLYNRNQMHNKFRLNIQKETLVCSDCLTDNVVSIDMFGRTAVILGDTYILCPCCCKVHLFQIGNNNWIKTCPLQPVVLESTHSPLQCDVCQETSGHLYQHKRVNHLTGEMQKICFCFKHNPNNHVMDQCTNMSQVHNLRIRRSVHYGKCSHKTPYNY